MVCLTNPRLRDEPLCANEGLHDPFPEVEEEAEERNEVIKVFNNNNNNPNLLVLDGGDDSTNAKPARNKGDQKPLKSHKSRKSGGKF